MFIGWDEPIGMRNSAWKGWVQKSEHNSKHKFILGFSGYGFIAESGNRKTIGALWIKNRSRDQSRKWRKWLATTVRKVRNTDYCFSTCAVVAIVVRLLMKARSGFIDTRSKAASKWFRKGKLSPAYFVATFHFPKGHMKVRKKIPKRPVTRKTPCDSMGTTHFFLQLQLQYL